MGGLRVTVAVPDLALLAALVALTVTVCCKAMEAGAVYNPVDEIVPTCGLIDQTTAVLPVPVTVAENCCRWPARRLTLEGLTETEMLVPGTTETVKLLLLPLADAVRTTDLVLVTLPN
jgi:hypothetical protein